MSDSFRIELDQLRAEVHRLTALEAARTCMLSVARAFDRLDRELMLKQFWPNAEVDYGVFYNGNIVGFVDVAMRFQGSMRDTQHLVGNINVLVDGASAQAESYVHAHHVIEQDGGLIQLMVGACYLSRFAQRDGEWRIIYQTEVLDWGRWLPIVEQWFEQNREMPKGQRGRDDLSYRLLGVAE